MAELYRLRRHRATSSLYRASSRTVVSIICVRVFEKLSIIVHIHYMNSILQSPYLSAESDGCVLSYFFGYLYQVRHRLSLHETNKKVKFINQLLPIYIYMNVRTHLLRFCTGEIDEVDSLQMQGYADFVRRRIFCSVYVIRANKRVPTPPTLHLSRTFCSRLTNVSAKVACNATAARKMPVIHFVSKCNKKIRKPYGILEQSYKRGTTKLGEKCTWKLHAQPNHVVNVISVLFAMEDEINPSNATDDYRTTSISLYDGTQAKENKLLTR
ncbi:unnamed protein product [Trichogramma brassicae]|uniref:CUB domain-containing protein n=1 Tax=Trichogramma brassicae TaxID=86971 RepID=A0A6H5I9K2_9HYME|nr:unnamed protein product [Trichogramma brassicae]